MRSLCSPVETNITLGSNSTPIIFFLKRAEGGDAPKTAVSCQEEATGPG